ncbi:MAG: hypothetical protein HRT66_11775 [Flavobacteriaceae bacterium]|nr:hypothetical protein [Flavobacteriaceae bacterium]
MKKVIVLLLVLVCMQGFAQKQRSTLYLRDGTVLKGLSKIRSNNKVKFRVDRDSESKTYSYRDIDKIVINESGSMNTYQYKIIQRKNSNISLMSVVCEGKLNLYKLSNTYTTVHAGVPIGAGFGPGFGGGFGSSNTIIKYYVGDSKTDFVEKISTLGSIFRKSFKKTASKYFKDCPSLVKLIKNKTYGRDDIEEIVRYYNDKCTEDNLTANAPTT